MLFLHFYRKFLNMVPNIFTNNSKYLSVSVKESLCSVIVAVQSLSCVWLCNPRDCSTPDCPIPHQLLELAHTHVHWVSDAIQPSVLHHPLLLLPSIFPNIRVFSNESTLRIRWPNIGASVSASVLLMSIQDWFPWGLTGLSCSPRDSQESSPTPQLKSLSSLVFGLLYGPTLTSLY